MTNGIIYTDYDPPKGPHVVLGGKLVPAESGVFAALAAGAMMLTHGGSSGVERRSDVPEVDGSSPIPPYQ